MVYTYPPFEEVEKALHVLARFLEVNTDPHVFTLSLSMKNRSESRLSLQGKVSAPCLGHSERMALIDTALLTEPTLPYLGHEAHREIMRRGTPNPMRG